MNDLFLPLLLFLRNRHRNGEGFRGGLQRVDEIAAVVATLLLNISPPLSHPLFTDQRVCLRARVDTTGNL